MRNFHSKMFDRKIYPITILAIEEIMAVKSYNLMGSGLEKIDPFEATKDENFDPVKLYRRI